MPFIVTEPCVQCKYTDCVEVCPMDCFVEGPNFLAIDPAGCIDCSVCVPQCPVDAIVNAKEANEAQQPYIAINAQAASVWPSIRQRQAPMPDHAQWAGVADKSDLLLAPT